MFDKKRINVCFCLFYHERVRWTPIIIPSVHLSGPTTPSPHRRISLRSSSLPKPLSYLWTISPTRKHQKPSNNLNVLANSQPMKAPSHMLIFNWLTKASYFQSYSKPQKVYPYTCSTSPTSYFTSLTHFLISYFLATFSSFNDE